MTAGLASIGSPLITAAMARYKQLTATGMSPQQAVQAINNEGIYPPVGELAAKLTALKNSAPQPPQQTINEQLDMQLQQLAQQQMQQQQQQQQQGLGALPEAQQAQAAQQQQQGTPQQGIPQGMPQGGPPPEQMPPQGMPQGGPPPEQMPPQGMPPQGMAAGGLTSIPVSNIGNQNAYAAGGIVAFNGGGDVKHFDGLSGSAVGSSPSNSPGLDTFTFSNGMTASMPSEGPDPERAEYEKLKYILESDLITLASKHTPPYGSNFGPEIERLISLRTDPTVKQRYVQLKQKIDQKDALAKQALTSDTNRLAAEEYGITPAAPKTTTPAASPTGEDDTSYMDKYLDLASKDTSAPTQAANVLPRSGTGAGTAPTTVGTEDYNTLISGAPEEGVTRDDLLKQRDVYEKAHNVGGAEQELMDFLTTQKGELDKDYKFNKSMALAQFGFTLASTPGSFLQGLAKSGVGFAQTMMDLNSKDKAYQRQNQLALLQAKAAKEKGDMATFDAATDDARSIRKDWIANKVQAATFMQSNKKLLLEAEQNQTLAQHYARSDANTANYNALLGASKTKDERLERTINDVMRDPKLTDAQKQATVDRLTYGRSVVNSLASSSLNAATSGANTRLNNANKALFGSTEYQRLKAQLDTAPPAKQGPIQQKLAELRKQYYDAYQVNSGSSGGGTNLGGYEQFFEDDQ